MFTRGVFACTVIIFSFVGTAKAETNPCVKSFSGIAIAGPQPSVYSEALLAFSPADASRLRKIIEELESKGVSREVILAELRNGGGVCGR